MKDSINFYIIMRNVMIVVIGLLIIFSIFSSVAYGYETKDIITFNLPHDNLSVTI
jgi:hypothetical protein